MKLISFKKHLAEGKIILAACDHEFLGKKLADKARETEFTVSEHFYGSGKLPEKDFLKVLDDDFDSINLLGDKTINVAIKKGVISKGNVTLIAGIRHAVVFSF